MICPQPTVFAPHPLIPLSPSCDCLAETLLDPDLQQIARGRATGSEPVSSG